MTSPFSPCAFPLGLGRPAWAWIGLVAVSLISWQGWSLASQRTAGTEAAPLWITESRLDDGRRLLVVLDQATRHAAVYHLDGATGTLVLRSTRDITWDLMVGDFNAQEPRPAALRKMLHAPPAEPLRGPVEP